MTKPMFVTVAMVIMLLVQGSANIIDSTRNAVLHNQRGVENLKDGYYLEAIQEFKLAIALNHDTAVSATFYNNLGLTYLKIKKYKWAISCFEKSLVVDPNFYEYYANLVHAHKLNGSMPRLYAGYKKQLDKNPDNSTAALMCGLTALERGQKTIARQYLETYLMMDSDTILSNAVKSVVGDLKN